LCEERDFAAQSHRLSDAGVADHVLWAVQAGEIRLSLNFVTPKGSAKFDPEATARFARVMQTPETATPRDIYTILFGSIDLATRAKMNRYYYSENGVDLESVKDPLNFNPRYYGKSRLEAQQEGYLDAASQFNEPEPDFRISYEDLFTWQREVVDALRHREDPRFGRSVHWLWEEKGAVGKSILAAYLVDCCGAIEVAGTSNDALHAITMYCQTHGEGPKVIVFDVPRSHSGIDYETIEKAKDGKYFSGKYNATSAVQPTACDCLCQREAKHEQAVGGPVQNAPPGRSGHDPACCPHPSCCC
jgi:hypothetical protein